MSKILESAFSYWHILSGNPIAITLGIVILLFVIGIILAVSQLKQGAKHQMGIALDTQTIIKTPKHAAHDVAPQHLAGIGAYPALVLYRDEKGSNVAWFTKIPTLVGAVDVATPSCPISGPICTVRELLNEKTGQYELKDYYSEQDRAIAVDETPERAYFATHWPIVRRVYLTYTPLLKSGSFWLAVIVGVGSFMFLLNLFS